MNAELVELEDKVGQVLALCQGLRSENQELRARLAGLECEKRRLSEKIDVAAGRIESLIEGLPQ
jgi:cell division protein ZapB